MKRNSLVIVYLLVLALLPVFLAFNQGIPTRFVTQQVVLLLSLSAFGLVLGQFWLSRLIPWDESNVKPAAVLRWHKVVGYTAGAFLLVHPVLMIARRFWVQESDPVDNFLLMLRAPALLPAVVAWGLMALIVVLALLRRRFRPKSWCLLHGLISTVFVGTATWHVVSVGRHSNAAMSLFWITLAAVAVGALLKSYLPVPSLATASANTTLNKGVIHEFPQ